ncbi:putative endoplasmic reticulum mannosyl-oligosaccharide 1,2-alpha-mannosidase [Kockovaella imperatae]|uniref:alpha-1,2-Mannosidase n=1 Tax=Kockovaella imperatae TaxID=4999 RepID=A0A1Y1UKZ7_9TREE|nr:putative endoplasmic reticulum mannosyl-oligosaccharide 1,2-alpha-mannosidase [Kockovaella imperatae]ORX38652.1 putative endoplasmic reticulum mannosyl-oligosaccharide 1,2-alpha-mannosidase [Kockovaella imperatae]
MSDLRARPGKGSGKTSPPDTGKTNAPSSTKKAKIDGLKNLNKEELERKLDSLEQTKMLRQVVSMLGLMAVAWFGIRLFRQYNDPLMAGNAPTAQPTPSTRWSDPNPLHLPQRMPGRLPADVEKRDEIKEAFAWSWTAYEKHAWGDDEFHPLSRSGSNLTAAGGVGYNIVDSLDSLLVMGFLDEYKRARDWCRDKLSFEKDAEFNTFETTIRILGGLLSAHHLTSVHEDLSIRPDARLYLSLAVDLADRLLGAFESPTGIPWSNINLARRKGIPSGDFQGAASLSEAGTLQLELKYLSHLTGDNIYWKKAERVTEIIRNQVSANRGIAPIFISPHNGQFLQSEIRLGSRGDSYYEYLLKQYLQTNREEPVYRDMYDEAMGGIKAHMIGQTVKSGIIFTQELHPARHPQSKEPTMQVVPKQDHLACFLGGSFLLGITEGGRREVDWQQLEPRDAEDFKVGRGIIEGCMMTHETATGLAPEIAMFVQWSDQRAKDLDWFIKPSQGGALIDARNILRPETVESLMLGYRITGDPIFREWGWKAFQAFQKHCRVEHGGYAGIEDVQVVPPKKLDRMETFWLGETLKYLYLLFDDSDHISLDKHVFNTEAHILPVFSPVSLTPFSTS